MPSEIACLTLKDFLPALWTGVDTRQAIPKLPTLLLSENHLTSWADMPALETLTRHGCFQEPPSPGPVSWAVLGIPAQEHLPDTRPGGGQVCGRQRLIRVKGTVGTQLIELHRREVPAWRHATGARFARHQFLLRPLYSGLGRVASASKIASKPISLKSLAKMVLLFFSTSQAGFALTPNRPSITSPCF